MGDHSIPKGQPRKRPGCLDLFQHHSSFLKPISTLWVVALGELLSCLYHERRYINFEVRCDTILSRIRIGCPCTHSLKYMYMYSLSPSFTDRRWPKRTRFFIIC